MHYFGTDGIRGPIGGDTINPLFIRQFGWALGTYIKRSQPEAVILIGRDTRKSGILFTQALAQGLMATGANVIDLGIAPTPAIAFCIKKLNATGGIALTASHNPASDNGLKPFDNQGLKLTLEAETAIEALIKQAPKDPFKDQPLSLPTFDAVTAYIAFTQGLIKTDAFTGFKLVLDTAHGATYRTSPALLHHAGVELIHIGDQPNGININEGVGSEHPEALAQAVLKHKADGGLAHDGDGDRLVCVDSTGKSLPGEVLLGALGLAALKTNTLGAKTLVTTVQSNGGLDQAIKQAGGHVIRTAVGDRHVLHALLNTGSTLGGESSGHYIFPQISPCGDGLIAALEVLQFLKMQGKSLADLHTLIPLFPQKQLSLHVKNKRPLTELIEFQSLYKEIEKALGPTGRLLVRYSGTENKLRFLIEGPDEAVLEAHLQTLVTAAKQALG